MSTYTQILYHIVFATKGRGRVLNADRRDDLWRYTWGILKNKNCHLYRINGVEDHLHILQAFINPWYGMADRQTPEGSNRLAATNVDNDNA